MNLPANLTLLPGVRQLPNGKLYRLGRYPSGKNVLVPYTESPDTEKARTIPVYVEPVKERKVLKLKGPAVVHELHIRFRLNNEKKVEHVRLDNWDQKLISELHPFCISPDCGQTWKRITTDYADFYNCWHEDVKEVEA